MNEAKLANPPRTTDALLSGLSDEQLEAVTNPATRLSIIAGAGSGKTRVLTRRVAWQAAQANIDARHALLLTFSRKAASELRARLKGLGLRDNTAAATFHSAALALLRRYWDHNRQSHLRLIANRLPLLRKVDASLDGPALAALDNELTWARAQLVTPERYVEAAAEAGRSPLQSHEFVASAYGRYQEAKRAQRVIDFDDVLALCHQVLAQDHEFGRAQRWYHRHLFVDEFQDVNPLQFAVLQAWLGEDSTLTIVGDPDQAIYGFNGADPNFIKEVDNHFPGIVEVRLTTNYRSTPEVVSAAARVLDKEPLLTTKESGNQPMVSMTQAAGEAAALAQAIREFRQFGARWRDQVVLARTNAQLGPLRSGLRALGVPTRSRDLPILKQAQLMDLLGGPGNDHLLGEALAKRSADRQSVAGEVDKSLLEAFAQMVEDHLAIEPNATVGSFMSQLRADDKVTQPLNAVEVCTFHSAKGLEWPIVHIVGMEMGYVPSGKAHTQAGLEEEQRLLYVAATRAQKALHVMWCGSRMMGGSLVRRYPSPYLEAFASDSADPFVAAPPQAIELRNRLAADGEP